jgi:hypothetical protein
MPDNSRKARSLAAKIAKQVRDGAGRGMQAAITFLAARVKETVGVQTPVKAVPGVGGGTSYRAVTPAVAGAPPRRVSGRLQKSVRGVMESPTRALIVVDAVSPRGFPYPKYLDAPGLGAGSGLHPFVGPTVTRYKGALETIVGNAVKHEVIP